ncbi:MAG: recombinase family protein [Streptosporangiaceae bacterium]
MLPDTAASKVTAAHLSRRAVLYVRQSSLKQVLHNTESAIRQYDLRGKAIALGWAADQITVIDIDQGHSGASAAGREGFQQMVAEVSLGRAGIVLGLECSRLARNNALFRYRNKADCSAYGFMPRRDREFLPRW